ncbi:MAG: TraM recognition domain-containing protein [Dethiobacter sp.]|jgi:hypothetical protein|nr:TraM recognition domain-containing protein [Dethiobacter sp.]
MALALAGLINHIIAWVVFIVQTRYILSPAPPYLVFALFAVSCILLAITVKKLSFAAGTSKLNAISILLLLSTRYVILATRWYVNEIPDLIIYSFVHGSSIVHAYWTIVMLPAVPATFILIRAANTALEEKPLSQRLKELPFMTVPGEEDLVICRTPAGKPVIIPGTDRYLNTIIGGPIGTGKSSRMLAPIIWQELNNIKKSMAKGVPRGLTVLEPKGDLTDKAAEMCEDLKIPFVYINPLRDDTARFNPLEGGPMLVAEATRTVLRSIGGKQEAFFALAQEIAARNTILLLKYTKGNRLSLPDVSMALRVPETLKEEVGKLETIIRGLEVDNERLLSNIRKLKAAGDTDAMTIAKREYDENRLQISARKGVVDYFKAEVFGSLKEKMFQFVLGLRLQFDDLAGNELLYKVIAPRVDEAGRLDYSSDVNLDTHLAQGGVLLVNSASNSLGRVGDAFGSYVIQHLQGAVFRRPGDETTRPRHTTVVDEVPLFIGTNYERMLSNGRSYRNENIIALQTTSQLILAEQKSFRETIMNLCRNKVFYGGMDAEEAKYISQEMGTIIKHEKAITYAKSVAFKMPWLKQSTRETQKDNPRYTYTDLMELPEYHVAYKIVQNNTPQAPGIGITDLCDWDKKRNRMCVEKKDTVPQEQLSPPQIVLTKKPSRDAGETESLKKTSKPEERPEIRPEDITGEPQPVEEEIPDDLRQLIYKIKH